MHRRLIYFDIQTLADALTIITDGLIPPSTPTDLLVHPVLRDICLVLPVPGPDLHIRYKDGHFYLLTPSNPSPSWQPSPLEP